MNRTIVQAIENVMEAQGKPLTVQEVYNSIIASNLYDEPIHVVRAQLRRHCKGLEFPSASRTKHFVLLPDGKYFLLSERDRGGTRVNSRDLVQESTGLESLNSLKRAHRDYLGEFRARVLGQLVKLEPDAFEGFCKNLLTAYGFRDVVVTRRTRDGGIDGHGRLKVGFAYFSVAFQCKRWTKRTVGRPEIDQFRGAIQGQHEQGIFFTTANFSLDAQSSSFKSGAVPVVLVNGTTIVDIMIEKQFGIETENLAVHSLALDLAIFGR